MPPKKDKKKAEPDETTNQLLPKYKRKCDALRTFVIGRSERALQTVHCQGQEGHRGPGPSEEDPPVRGNGPAADHRRVRDPDRPIVQARAEHKVLSLLRLWKLNTRDAGLGPIVQYIKDTPGVQKLDLLDNGVTEEGCAVLYDIISIDAPL